MTSDTLIARRSVIGLAAAASMYVGGLARAAPTYVEAKEDFVSLPGGRLSYWDTGGEGDALIFLHPGTGSEKSWKNQRHVFAAQGYRVIAYSRWGYGGSDKAPDDGRKDFEDLHLLIRKLGLGKVHLVGVAAGSTVVAPLVAEAPEIVASAALIGSVIGISDEDIQAIYHRIRPDNFHAMSAEFRELSGSYRAAHPGGVEAWKEIESTRPEHSARRTAKASLASLAASKVPFLFATGDADLYAPPYLMRLAASRIPSAHYATITEAGHAPFWEQPDAFNALLLEHLRRQR